MSVRKLYSVITLVLLVVNAWHDAGAQVVTPVADLGPACRLCIETPRHFINYQGALYTGITRTDSGANFFRFDGDSVQAFEEITLSAGHPFARNMAVFNGELILLGWDSAGSSLDMEMWRFDGTSFDAIPIVGNPTAFGYGTEFLVYKNQLYFGGADSEYIGLWRYDGDSIRRADTTSFPAYQGAGNLTVMQEKLYFTAIDTANKQRVWQFDGNTVSLVTGIPAELGSNCCGFDIMAYHSGLFFVHNDGIHGNELWKYNGFKSVMVADILSGPNSSNPIAFTVANDRLLMLVNDGVSNGLTIRAYDDQGLTLVASHLTVPLDFTRRPFASYKGNLYFTALMADNPTYDSLAIYRFDGQQTHKVADSLATFGWQVFEDELYFGGGLTRGSLLQVDLWKITDTAVAVSVHQPDAMAPAFRVFPNPSEGMLTVEGLSGFSAPVQVRVLDLLGREVSKSELLQPTAGNTVELDLCQHPPGLYTVILEVEGVSQAYRVVLR